MSELLNFFARVSNFLWNGPMIVIVLVTHLYFTWATKGIQRLLFTGIRLSFSGGQGSGGLKSREVISTILASTIGTGSMIGVGTAIALGGPGAVFWCAMGGFFGIATSYAENFLAAKYGVFDGQGRFHGGAMYLLQNKLNKKGLAALFAVCTIFAGLGIGCSVQANAIYTVSVAQSVVSKQLIGIIMFVVTLLSVSGGLKPIAKLCTKLVAPMTLMYLCGCVYLLFAFRSVLIDALQLILVSAFSFKSAICGAGGYTLLLCMRYGLSRGLFSNEAGMGSAPLVSGDGGENTPHKKALCASSSIFWDTLVVCTLTGIVIVCYMLFTGHTSGDGAALVSGAFSFIPSVGGLFFALAIAVFCYLTIVGWYCYASEAVYFLFHKKDTVWFSLIWSLFAYFGVVLAADALWASADLFNALMMLPNIYVLYAMREQIKPDV